MIIGIPKEIKEQEYRVAKRAARSGRSRNCRADTSICSEDA